MKPTFPEGDSRRAMQAHQRALRAAHGQRPPGKFNLARLAPLALDCEGKTAEQVINSVLRDTLPIGPGPAADALRRLVNGPTPS